MVAAGGIKFNPGVKCGWAVADFCSRAGKAVGFGFIVFLAVNGKD
jgi:hypothetical protein